MNGCAIGVIGLGVMGAALARNFHSRGLRVAGFNWEPEGAASFAAQWGDDLLATSGLSVAEQRAITYSGTCDADIRVVFANRAAEERRGLNLCTHHVLRITPGWTTSDSP